MKEVFSLSTPVAFPKFEEKLTTALPDLPRLEAQVAQYMVLNISNLSFETGASLARKVGVSEVTVSRLLRRLGYQGMRGLKRQLQEELYNEQPANDRGQESVRKIREISDAMTRSMEIEQKSLREIYQQRASPMWPHLVQAIVEANEVYVTGFQAVRGMAEDCARRLAILRGNVRFLSAHDSMLTEWLGSGEAKSGAANRCLIVIDVVPYARESAVLSKLCHQEGHSLVVFTDEMCHWAKNYTDMVVYASTRTGLVLESTVAIAAAINLMVNAVAEQCAPSLNERLNQWKTYTRALKIF